MCFIPSSRVLEVSTWSPNAEYTVTGRSWVASPPILMSGIWDGVRGVSSRHRWTWLDGKKGHNISKGGEFLREDIQE